jgi:hypothetical protein
MKILYSEGGRKVVFSVKLECTQFQAEIASIEDFFQPEFTDSRGK